MVKETETYGRDFQHKANAKDFENVPNILQWPLLLSSSSIKQYFVSSYLHATLLFRRSKNSEELISFSPIRLDNYEKHMTTIS